MALTNIFDLCEWDVYVQYNGISGASPDSQSTLVHIDNLDPSIGYGWIKNGVLFLDMENGSGGGGAQPELVLLPKGSHPGGKLTVTMYDGKGESFVDYLDAWQSGGLEEPIGLENYELDGESLGKVGVSWDFSGETDVATITTELALAPNSAIGFGRYAMGF